MIIQSTYERFTSLPPIVDGAIMGVMAGVFVAIIRFGFGVTETARFGFAFTLSVPVLVGVVYLLYRVIAIGYPWLVDQLQAYYRAYEREQQWEEAPK